MPIYQYRCTNCGRIEDIFMSFSKDAAVPITQICSKCGFIATKIFSTPNINTGAKSRVYFQWKGDPRHCPPEIRDALKNQDKPKGVSEFSKEGEPVLGTGDKFVPKE